MAIDPKDIMILGLKNPALPPAPTPLPTNVEDLANRIRIALLVSGLKLQKLENTNYNLGKSPEIVLAKALLELNTTVTGRHRSK